MKIQKENIGARTRNLWPAAVGSGAYTLCENIKIKRIFEQRISNSQEYQDRIIFKQTKSDYQEYHDIKNI